MTQYEFEKEWSADADYVVCHTSGSTGMPKEICLDKEMMRRSARRTNDFFGITSESRLHTCLDFNYIASKMMTVRADVAGCRLTSETPSNRPLQDIGEEEEITLLSVVPSQMQGILSCGYNFGGIRHILIGGCTIPGAVRRQISLSGYDAWESYGMTETASHIALRKITDDDTVPFTTLPGITVRLDENDCLVVSLPDMADVHTTDLAELISETEFRILGRADNCINSGGIKIIPEQLESLLGPFIAFNYCFSSRPDEKWGQRLVLVVETDGSTLDDEILRKAITVRLAQYKKNLNLGAKTPKEILFVNHLPLTANGKIDRKKLREIVETL